jgi:serine phosphatase RsbU (regulator of sigma subunit)
MNTLNGHSPFTLTKLFLRNTWKDISYLGLDSRDSQPKTRAYILSNQINFILAVTMTILGLVLLTRLNIQDRPVTLGHMRIWYTLILCIVNLALAFFKQNRISKLSLIFLAPMIFIIIPIMSGYVEEEGYLYNAYVLIAASIIPQLVINSEKEKFFYWSSMLFYFLMVFSIDSLALKYGKEYLPISDHINQYFFIDKLAHVMVFFFINVSIYHLRKVNFRYEDRLFVKNQILNDQNHKLQENSRKILQQKEIIEQHSTAINDSINYAAMIQQAVLLPPDFMNDWGLSNFILYKPKAVVSGDFYWGISRKDSLVIVAADCTGHGVPGAFMSMLGLTFLDDIFSTCELRKASEILNILREQVIHKLRQKGNIYEMRDGMDISVSIINRTAGTLEFAGANNPLYLIRDGNLIKIPADKMPIGIYSSAQNLFTNNTSDLKIDDRIYMFSDGYADQFGGVNGKKLTYRHFQEVLLQHHKKPMEEQKVILDNYFEEWRGEHVQVDDVLLIGIQI